MDDTTTTTYLMTSKTGSLILMAPEVFKQGEPYNQKADVYSFAMLLWHMLALELPYLEFVSKKDRSSFETNVMERGKRPVLKGPKHIQMLLQRAWAQDYNKRPSMEEICVMLEQPPEEEEEAPSSLEEEDGFVTKEETAVVGTTTRGAGSSSLMGGLSYYCGLSGTVLGFSAGVPVVPTSSTER
eukprot:CAMPEP_0194037844 /NCGR_PEP_ID=MMETSP0009_2-20130614/10175_1 /TAXON_ID=210454 /ORGANISM="Grammatophora oceanica, Strain CCMP 410" /LENGTH=183 /DNA_ID=CAMNT_0038680169 /DNA_START=66 /DNA_END=613 /DNA_ORIENTATION=+